MDIHRLKEGTKLMWDAPYIPFPDKRIVYPATVGEHNHARTWRMVYFSARNSQWMGPEVEYLREPTEQELKELTWPETRYGSPKTSP